MWFLIDFLKEHKAVPWMWLKWEKLNVLDVISNYSHFKLHFPPCELSLYSADCVNDIMSYDNVKATQYYTKTNLYKL